MSLLDALRAAYFYDPETGVFTSRHSGKPIMGKNNIGYVSLAIARRTYSGHRMAWLYVHGTLPIGHIDHINADKADNRIANLRDVAPRLNMQNLRTARRSNSTGFLGVCRTRTKFLARIHYEGRYHLLGTFNTAAEAHAAYLVEKRKHHEGNTL